MKNEQQINSLRENYNKLASKRSMTSKTKKIQWENKRRFTSI